MEIMRSQIKDKIKIMFKQDRIKMMRYLTFIYILLLMIGKNIDRRSNEIIFPLVISLSILYILIT